MPDAETAFLAASAAAHASRLNVDRAAHSAFCGCGRRPTFCARCDRDVDSFDLVFAGSDFRCEDCASLLADDNNQPAIAAE
jgi:hypothetical protein